jgi:hypothetical protein
MSTELEATEGLVRIRVPLDRSASEPGPADDWVWGEPLGNGRYRVESCPFFAYGISRNDVVRAQDGTGQESPQLEDVIEKSGHRTLRLALDPEVTLGGPDAQKLLERLLEMGCTHELLRPKIVAIDLPPQADLEAVAGVLQEQARAGSLVWEWADPRPS